jgi:hypothetical protein
MTNEKEEKAETFPEHSHEDMYLVGHHQGDGFNYSTCTICGWAKPDMSCRLIKQELAKRDEAIAKLKKRDEILSALEQAGVDNWEGYSEAMDILRGE